MALRLDRKNTGKTIIMAQNLETYYGFRLELAKEIKLKKDNELREMLSPHVEELQAKAGGDFSLYVSLAHFLMKRDRVFGLGPLSARLQNLKLKWRVNPEEQRKGTLVFLNETLPNEKTLIDLPKQSSFGKVELSCELDGSYVESSDGFRMLVVAAIDSSVKPSRRKVTLSATAHPTSEFFPRFRNSDGVKNTKVDYYLTRSVQMLFDIV